MQLHQREWYCDACLESFSQKALFQEHISVRHPELGAQGHFEAVIRRCERAIITDLICPLCGVNSTLQTLEKHLGLHLQEVALFALPHFDEDNSSSKSDELDNSSEGIGEHLSRESSFEIDSDDKESMGYQPFAVPGAVEGMKCICSYQHDDGFTVCCGKCNDRQHGKCMSIDPGHIPDAYECSACNPGAHHLEVEKAIYIQESFLRSWKHDRIHTRPCKCPFEGCYYFELGFPNEKLLYRHWIDKHSQSPPGFKCQYPPCSYSSRRESNCKHHMEKAHGYVYIRTKQNYKTHGVKRPSSLVHKRTSDSATIQDTVGDPAQQPLVKERPTRLQEGEELEREWTSWTEVGRWTRDKSMGTEVEKFFEEAGG